MSLLIIYIVYLFCLNPKFLISPFSTLSSLVIYVCTNNFIGVFFLKIPPISDVIWYFSLAYLFSVIILGPSMLLQMALFHWIKFWSPPSWPGAIFPSVLPWFETREPQPGQPGALDFYWPQLLDMFKRTHWVKHISIHL